MTDLIVDSPARRRSAETAPARAQASSTQRRTRSGEAAWPVVASRLQSPLQSPYEVARSETCDEIFAAGGARVVLISAPAGFGKTTLMRQVRQRCESAGLVNAWINLEPADNDVSRFLAALAAALDPMMPGVSVDNTGRPFETANGQLAGQLLERISKHEEPFVLFLDDFEAVQSASLLSLVRQIIHALPLGAQLVIGSRTVPNLGLGRMRAIGSLLQIEVPQLRFTEQESTNFLRNARQLQLEDDEIRRLHQKTEGWAAALWLASLALSARAHARKRLESRTETATEFIDRFSGSDAAIADYLAEDVLVHLPDDLRVFLLRTSILDPLNASLCDAVCGCNDSQQQLERLEQNQLFLTRLDEQRQSYRYHGLFKQFLQNQLRRTLPEEAPELHLSAARWYEKEGRPLPAIEHALASGDLEYALPLLAEHAVALLSDGHMMLLSRWLGGLAPDDLQRIPMLCAVHAWATNFTRGPHEAMALLQRLEGQTTLDEELRAHFHSLKTILLLRMDRIEEAYEWGIQHLDCVIRRSGFPAGVLCTALGTLAIIRGQDADAQDFLSQARRIGAPMHSSLSVVLSESIAGSFDLLHGHLHEAVARLRSIAEGRVEGARRSSKGNALGGVLLAEALYETDACVEAERLLTGYLPSIIDGGLPDQIISAHVLLARLQFKKGDYDQALQFVLDLEHLGYRLELPRLVASAKLERTRLALLKGSVAAARQELDLAADEDLWGRASSQFLVGNDADTFEIGMLRWQINAGRAAEAIAPLREKLAAAEGARRARRALKLRILLGAALYLTNDKRKAVAVFHSALVQGAAEGFIRSFVDEGPTITNLVHEWMSSPESVHVPRRYIEQLLKAMGSHVETDAEAAGKLKEPLSRKEIVVLRWLAEGLSNRALAQKLFVSETTIRSHLRSINAKFGVHSRTQAVAAGRRHAIIP